MLCGNPGLWVQTTQTIFFELFSTLWACTLAYMDRNLRVEQLTQVPADGYDVKTHYQYVEDGLKTTRGDSPK